MNVINTLRSQVEHREIWLQIPWYVNDSAKPRQRDRIEAHLHDCTVCREELQQQRALHEAMADAAVIEHIPSASLNKLRQRLDAAPATAHASSVHSVQSQGPVRRRLSPRQVLLAASVAVIAIALTLALTASRRADTQVTAPDSYYTVSSAPQRPAHEVIRAVFAPTTTVSQLQRLLDESGLRIIAGPSEAGVYSLAATRQQAVSDALSRLRRQPLVRFAEATVPLPARETR